MSLRPRLSSIVIVALAVLGRDSFAQQGASRDTISRADAAAIRYDSAGRNQLRLVGQRYLFARVYMPGVSRSVVIHEVSDQRCCIREASGTPGGHSASRRGLTAVLAGLRFGARLLTPMPAN